MTSPRIELAPAQAELRRRCQALGLPAWRTDSAGEITAEPPDEGTAGLFFRSGAISRMVSAAAAGAPLAEKSVVCELYPGCWLVGVPELQRRLRLGLTAVLVMSPAALSGDAFAKACESAQLDRTAVRRALADRAIHPRATADQLARSLDWMRQDLSRIHEDSGTLTGFTRQLSDCYETMDLLYSLGRSMNDLTQPDSFVRQLVKRLHATVSFSWLVVKFADDPAAEPRLRGRAFSALGDGSRVCPADGHLMQLISRLTQRDPTGPEILDASEVHEAPDASQVVVQAIRCAGKIIGVLVLGDKFGDDPHVSSYDTRLVEAAGGYLSAFLENAALYAGQKSLFLGTLEALTASIDAKDRYTCGHSQRVAHLASKLARSIGLSEQQCERVRIAGLVHDVGKIGVPEAVLCKTGKLTDEEFAQIKRHPEIGHRILKDIPSFDDVLEGVLHHHERWDAKGYPRRLAGHQIPLVARLLALADTFDAMSSTRSYRPAMPREKVLDEIRRCGGIQFDPELVGPMCALDFTEFDRMVAELGAEHAARQAA